VFRPAAYPICAPILREDEHLVRCVEDCRAGALAVALQRRWLGHCAPTTESQMLTVGQYYGS
jgi:hypothetical protein